MNVTLFPWLCWFTFWLWAVILELLASFSAASIIVNINMQILKLCLFCMQDRMEPPNTTRPHNNYAGPCCLSASHCFPVWAYVHLFTKKLTWSLFEIELNWMACYRWKPENWRWELGSAKCLNIVATIRLKRAFLCKIFLCFFQMNSFDLWVTQQGRFHPNQIYFPLRKTRQN